MMSRTHKDDVRHSHHRHPDAPYWAFGWCYRHGNKRSSAAIRRLHNRSRRARARDQLVNEQEPMPEFNGLSWIYW